MRTLSADAREKLARFADGMAVAVAVTLPWSTSGSAICTVIWLVALIPTIDPQHFSRCMRHPAAWLPVALFAFAAIGMSWADTSLAARLDGLDSYVKLLVIPLLLAQFSRSERGYQVFAGFLISGILLLAASGLSVVFPSLTVWGWSKSYGVPVKDYISQSAVFTICAFGLFYWAFDEFRSGRLPRAVGMIALGALFLGNIFFIVASRTSLVTIPVLLLLLCVRHQTWRNAAGMGAAAVLLAGAVWFSSDNVRHRLGSLAEELRTYQTMKISTSAGERYEFWKRSLGIIEGAPFLGHGTGSIRETFQRSVAGQKGVGALVADNPHNQTFAVGIQLGLAGILLLYAMWVVHFLLFRCATLTSWIGVMFVVQNVVGSLANSHLFDSTHGWLYAFGVGVAGGMILKESMPPQAVPEAAPAHAERR